LRSCISFITLSSSVALRPLNTLWSLIAGIAFRSRRSYIPSITLCPLRTSISRIAFGADSTIVSRRSLWAGVALQALGAGISRISLNPLRAGIPYITFVALRACWSYIASISLRTLRPRWPACALLLPDTRLLAMLLTGVEVSVRIVNSNVVRETHTRRHAAEIERNSRPAV
jgi:hypothetical protein